MSLIPGKLYRCREEEAFFLGLKGYYGRRSTFGNTGPILDVAEGTVLMFLSQRDLDSNFVRLAFLHEGNIIWNGFHRPTGTLEDAGRLIKVSP